MEFPYLRAERILGHSRKRLGFTPLQHRRFCVCIKTTRSASEELLHCLTWSWQQRWLPWRVKTFLARQKCWRCRRRNSSRDGEPSADEDMQSHFPIHLGCTKMNWERKQTEWWRDLKIVPDIHVTPSHSKKNCRRLDELDTNSRFWFHFTIDGRT